MTFDLCLYLITHVAQKLHEVLQCLVRYITFIVTPVTTAEKATDPGTTTERATDPGTTTEKATDPGTTTEKATDPGTTTATCTVLATARACTVSGTRFRPINYKIKHIRALTTPTN